MKWANFSVFFSILFLSSLLAETPRKLKFENVFPGLNFELPMGILFNPQDKNIAYIAGHKGFIWRVDLSKEVKTKEVILDISAKIGKEKNEAGLLDMVFHPDFAANRKIILSYSNEEPKEDRISSFILTEKGIDLKSEKIHFKLPRQDVTPNVGHIAFGPDGYLYVGVSDGGLSGDPNNNAQNKGTLFGSILRIELNDSETGYAIPKDNPFVHEKESKGEIWAYGFRVPWRFSFDKKTGIIYGSDVGQDKMEEINIVEKGKNYGWSVKEGTLDYKAVEKKGETYVEPIAVYDREYGLSVIGGYVYRGSIKSLEGVYIYCDYITNNFWGLRYDGEKVTEKLQLGNHAFNATTFSQDAEGEVYIMSSRDNSVYKIMGLR